MSYHQTYYVVLYLLQIILNYFLIIAFYSITFYINNSPYRFQYLTSQNTYRYNDLDE